MLTSAISACAVQTTSDVLREAGIDRSNAESQTNVLFCLKED